MIFSGVGTTYAQDNSSKINTLRVDVKCYVELLGGTETISFWRIKSSLLPQLTKTIIGKKIEIIPRPLGNKKGTIYQAKECILAEEDFTSLIANTLEDKIPK